MKIKCFEEVNSWIEARELTKRIYKAISTNNFSKDFSLSDQLRRASVSIMANIAEGFDSQSNDEFIRFLIYARRSCSEVQSHLYVALDQKYLEKNIFDELFEKTTHTAKLINGLITYLRSAKRPNKLTGKLENRQTGKPAN